MQAVQGLERLRDFNRQNFRFQVQKKGSVYNVSAYVILNSKLVTMAFQMGTSSVVIVKPTVQEDKERKKHQLGLISGLKSRVLKLTFLA